LSKRAALSLNTIASVLGRDDDEIIFVDYNTADDLPTFPETVADTLTCRARALLKIIRVRPHHHLPYKPHTDMVVIEAISRNIAIRRVNKSCQWVLCTNTDMIFNTDAKDTSLTDIAASLAKGLYHIPRFELPETLWENFDRSSPGEARTFLRKNAKTMGLEVCVEGPADTLYDYCGDFQLIHLDLLHEIQAFDETMLLKGWCDPNIARRLQKHGYPAKSLFPTVKGFHCGHHRGFEAPDKKSRSGPTKNDAELYFYNLQEAIPPYQPPKWGFKDLKLETFQLNSRIQYSQTIQNICSGLNAKSQNIAYPPELRNSLIYQSETILPFLADLLWTITPESEIALIGVNPQFANIFATFAEQMSLNHTITTLGKDCEMPAGATENADVILLNFGLEYEHVKDMDDNALVSMLEPMDEMIDHVIQEEDQRLKANKSHRRFIFINAERALRPGLSYHNQLWFYAKLAPEFHISIVPLQSRVCYGYLKTPSTQFHALDLAQPLSEHPGFKRQLSSTEIMALYSQVRYICEAVIPADQSDIPPEFLKPTLAAIVEILLDIPHCPLPRDALEKIHSSWLLQRPSQRCAGTITVPVNTETHSVPAHSVLADYRAWDNADWLAWAKRFGEGIGDPQDSRVRSAQSWAQIQILFKLDRFGLLDGMSRLRLDSKDASRMVTLLAKNSKAIDLLPDIDTTLSQKSMSSEQKLEAPAANREAYLLADVAISQMHPKKCWGAVALIPALFFMAEKVKLGGTLLLESDIKVIKHDRPSCLNAAHLASGEYARILEGFCGLKLENDNNYSMNEFSIDCFSRLHQAPMMPKIVTEFPSGVVVTSAVIALHKEKAVQKEYWRRAQVEAIRLEEGLAFFQPTTREPSDLISRGIPLFPGQYEMTIKSRVATNVNVKIENSYGHILFKGTRNPSHVHNVIFTQEEHENFKPTAITISIAGDGLSQSAGLQIEFSLLDLEKQGSIL